MSEEFFSFFGVKVKVRSNILLFILGELPGRGSMAVAVSVSDIRHVTYDTIHMTPDM